MAIFAKMCSRRLKIAVVYFIAVALAAGGGAADGEVASRTTAQDVDISKVPYIVRLISRTNTSPQLCGGTLVGPQHVVTAAHCFDEEYKENIVVIGGVTTLHDQGVRRRISKLHIHPQYREDHPRMDIAVIKLNESMPIGGNIQTMKLCDKSKSLKEDDVIQVSGWGRISKTVDEPSEHLHTASIPLMAKDECVKQYFEYNSALFTRDIFDASLCGKPRNSDACRGDSGGPGIHEGELCAAVSWGAGCDGSEYPGVYTSINLVRDFIEEKLKL